ncbi:hypothetical protein [Streptomyces mirabilis]|uniref:hypothetical protein n=1 Tax=Streptomyces mirabilis TaxID=68239 RepID=UPI0036C5BF6A
MTNAVRDWKTPELAHRRAGLPTHRWDRTASNWTPADSPHGSLSDWQDRRDSVRERHLSSGTHFLTVRIAAPSVADENETSLTSDLVIRRTRTQPALPRSYLWTFWTKALYLRRYLRRRSAVAARKPGNQPCIQGICSPAFLICPFPPHCVEPCAALLFDFA